MRARAELRSHVAGILVLVVIVGLIGGMVIAAAAGARRTASAYPRLVRQENALSLVVEVKSRSAATSRSIMAGVLRLPQVKGFSIVQIANGHLKIPGRKGGGEVAALVTEDGRFGRTINGVKILQGRMYDPNAPGEIVPSFSVAANLGLRVGEHLQLLPGGFFGSGNSGPGPGPNPPPPVDMRVVGIGAAPGFFEPLAGGYIPAVMLSPAFDRAHHAYIDDTDLNAAVVFRHGVVDQRPFILELKRIREQLPAHSFIHIPFNGFKQTAGVQQATRVQAVALWVLAALVGFAGIAVFTQALARQTFVESTEYPTLRSLGMSPGQLVAVGIIRAVTIGLGAAVVAVAVGLALSPLLPVGVARIAEPHPGFAVDGLVVGVGAAATILLVTLLSAPPAWRASRAAGNALGTADVRGAERPSAVAGFLSRTALPPSATAGVRMALEPGRGRTAVPVRAAMFGATLSLLALSAALVFAASLNHLVGTPALVGWNWNFVAFTPPATTPKGAETAHRLDAFLDRSRQVEGYAVGTIGDLTVKGQGMLSVTIEPRKGDVTPSLVEGTLPEGSDEIVLGSETMRTLGIGLGDSVEVTGQRGSARMRVVGRFVMPLFFFSTIRPGQGADLSLAGADRLFGQENGRGVFVRLAPGVRQRAFMTEMKQRVGPFFPVPRLESSKVHSLSGATGAPIVLAGVVALMATATLGHTLITSIRRRRLDLAILKTLGFNRRQVSSTVAWQATSLALVAILVGLPLGVIGGRWVWSVFADRLGVVPDPVVPILAVSLAVPATIVLANLLAVVPGRIAARLKAGPVLRSE